MGAHQQVHIEVFFNSTNCDQTVVMHAKFNRKLFILSISCKERIKHIIGKIRMVPENLSHRILKTEEWKYSTVQ
jgi:hypothetical protein